jgi:hypothetical protein
VTAQRALAVNSTDESLESVGEDLAVQASAAPVADELDPESRRIYLAALHALRRARVEFLIGGAYALAPYTGVVRDTKDLDVFIRRRDCEAALSALAAAGFGTELTFPHWLAKAAMRGRVIDLIFSSGNAIALIDDDWFTHAVPGEVLGVPVLLCPPEEMIWSKGFIMERERYDGADVAHLIRACGARLDWRRLLGRFDRRWRVLLSHLILFGFIYPGERAAIPEAVVTQLLRRLDREHAQPVDDVRVCDGTLLSRQQYLLDITREGYADGRLVPRGEMTPPEIAHWTAAIAEAAASPPDPRPDAAPCPQGNHSNGRSGSRARRRRR